MPYYPYYQGQPTNLPVNQPVNQPVQPPAPPMAPQMQAQPQINIICRPVASIEEAKAVPTDFSGAMLVLTDFSHGAIYTKALNYQDGTALFNCYRLDNSLLNPPVPAAMPAGDYVPRAEFDALKEEIIKINDRIGGMSNAGTRTGKRSSAADAE